MYSQENPTQPQWWLDLLLLVSQFFEVMFYGFSITTLRDVERLNYTNREEALVSHCLFDLSFDSLTHQLV